MSQRAAATSERHYTIRRTKIGWKSSLRQHDHPTERHCHKASRRNSVNDFRGKSRRNFACRKPLTRLLLQHYTPPVPRHGNLQSRSVNHGHASMTKRGRYIWLGVFAVIGAMLAWGAWHPSPGQDPDNQGGYAIVLLFLMILPLIYLPLGVRWLIALFRRSKPADPQPPGDA
jgi:hypothetical protein